MNILIHYDKAAKRADLAGFPYFAAAIRALLVKEIEYADRNTFLEWVLGLPHEVEDVEAVYVDGVELTPNQFLESLGKGCNCGQPHGFLAGGHIPPPHHVPLFRFEDRWGMEDHTGTPRPI